MTDDLRIEGIGRLVLHHLIQFVEELEITRVNRVVLDAGQVHEMRLAGFLGFGHRVKSPGSFDALDGLLHVAVAHEGAHEQPIAKGPRANHKVTLGNVPLVAWWQKHVFAALAFVRACQSDIGDPAKIGIVDRAEYPGWNLHDGRTFLDVDFGDAIDRRGVWREQQRSGVRQALGYTHAVGAHSRLLLPLQKGVDGGCRHTVEEGIDAPRRIEIVVNLVDCLRRRQPVEEFQIAKPLRLHQVRSLNRLRNIRRVFRCLLRKRRRMDRKSHSNHRID